MTCHGNRVPRTKHNYKKKDLESSFIFFINKLKILRVAAAALTHKVYMA